jgi:hypothetical protein
MDTERAGTRGAVTDLDAAGSPYSSEREESLSLSQGVREAVSDLSKALQRRCGVDKIWGGPLHRLERIAMESNGNLPKVLAAAGAPGGPDKLLERIGYLEALMTAPPPPPPAPKREPEMMCDPEDGRWFDAADPANAVTAAKVRAWQEKESAPCDPTS